MRGWQPADVSEGGGVGCLVRAEQQEIGDREVVQIARYARMQADAIERVAEDDGLLELRVAERLHAEMIARAKKTMVGLVPHREREVAEQMRYAILAPDAVGAEDQFHVRSIRGELLSSRPELGDEILPRIHSRVGHDPPPAVERERLLLALRLLGDSQQGVTEADVLRHPHALPVRTAKGQVLRHPAEQGRIDRRTVQIQHADNAAHACLSLTSVAGPASISFWPSSWSMNASRSARNCAGSTSYSRSSSS